MAPSASGNRPFVAHHDFIGSMSRARKRWSRARLRFAPLKSVLDRQATTLIPLSTGRHGRRA